MKNMLTQLFSTLQHPKSMIRLMLVVFLLSSAFAAQAQTGKVSGTITDSNGDPLIGANLILKGTTLGTITDFEAKFILDGLPLGNQILVASFIGFKITELEVSIVENQTTTVNIVLEEDITSLDELVVIGYGVQKKKLSTGATAQVKGEDLAKRNTTDALQAMQGQTPGVSITSTSGQPGEGARVTIRGLGTVGNAGPLYIVDGVQTGDINYLNNSDIESIDVLKDAASAAIYGSQSANGVILITTKQGKKGKSQLTFDAYYGVQNRAKSIDLLDANQYAQIMNEQHLNSGGTVSNMPFAYMPEYTAKGAANTNWLNEMFVSNAITQNYNLGVSGGSEQTAYSLSINYTGQEGVVGGKTNSNYERYGARFNSENALYDGIIKVGQHLTFTYTKKNGIGVGDQYGNTLRGAFNSSPIRPMYDNEGNFFNAYDNTILDQNGNPYWNDAEAHPYASMVLTNQNLTNTQKLIGDVYMIIEPVENLKFRSSVSLDYFSEDYRSYTPEYRLSLYSFANNDKVSQSMSKGHALSFDNTLSYSKNFGNHKLDAMLGMWMQRYKGVWMNAENSHLGFNDFYHAYLSNATNNEAVYMSMGGAPNENTMHSYFGRIQYNYNETYLFNATLRADGSSRFAAGNQWGSFPSFSAGWVISNEAFMEPVTHLVNFMKLRASWGRVGNQNIGDFQYLAPIQFTQATYNFGSVEGTSTNGAFPKRLSNPELKWETSEQLNLGFDSRYLNSNLSFTFDWYRKMTKDWLLIVPVLATAGTDAPFVNGGNVINSGVELVLSYQNRIGDFSYSISANGAYNKNEVQDIPTDDGIIHGATNTLYNNSSEFYRAESGHPIGFFWGYQTDGLFQNTAEILEYQATYGKTLQSNPKPGDVRYVDQNNDQKIDENDKNNLGDPNPDFTYGLNLAFNYKAIDFGLFVNGVLGNQIVQSYRNHTDKYANYTSVIMDRWYGEGTSDRIPRVTNSNINYQFSDLFIQEGSYLRISNLTLGYDLAQKIKLENFSQCRIYASVQNLYTFTAYDGMDPEVGYGFDNGATDKFSSGIDLGFYPRPRTVLVGVSVKF
ncbi:MAG: SusC/RagA family TonB-linked outer membrane protein [Salinivirgaceae bacterium]